MISTLREYQKAQLLLSFPDVSTLFYPKIQVSIFHLGLDWKPSTCTRVAHWTICRFWPCVTILIVRKIWKKLWFWFISVFKSKCLRNYRFDFFHRGLNRKSYTCRRGFDRNTKDFELHIRIRRVRKFREKLFGSIFVSCFSVTTGFVSCNKVSIENHKLLVEKSL